MRTIGLRSPLFAVTAITTLTMLLGPGGAMGQSTWNGTNSIDWNNAANWSAGVPNGVNAVINTNGPNICTVTNTPSTNPVDIIVGNGGSNNGRVDVRSGSLQTGSTNATGNWFMMGLGTNTASGTLNLANTAVAGGGISGFGQGSGNLTVGKIWLGGADFQGSVGGAGTVNMNTTGSLIANSTQDYGYTLAAVILAYYGGSSGTFNLENGTVQCNSEFWVGMRGTGVFNQSGGVVNNTAMFFVGFYGTGTYNLSGGTVNAGGGADFADLGLEAGSTGIVNVTGGTLNASGTGELRVGDSGVGTLTVSGSGLVTVSNTVDGLRLGAGSGSSGTVNLNGGTIQAALVSQGSGAGTFNFNGGTLRAGASSTTFMQGLSAAVVQSGGAIIDTTNFNITIAQALSNGGGGLIKKGSGTLTLAGSNTYSGTTVITNGTLNYTGSFGGSVNLAAGTTLRMVGAGANTLNGSLTLAAGSTTFSLSNGVANTLTITSGLTLNNGNNLNFGLGSVGTSDEIILSGGSLAVSGTVTINLCDIAGFGPGTYTLVSGGGLASTNGFVLGAKPAAGGFTYALGVSGGNLQVTITTPLPAVAFWKGNVDANWSTLLGGTNSNWATGINGATNTASPPGLPTAVTFTTTNASNFSTTLGANFEIDTLTFLTANNVTVGGANTLTVDGLLAVNSGAGTVTISAGALNLGFSEIWTNNSSNPLIVNSPVGGSGNSLTLVGPGQTILNSNCTYSGGTVINGGTLTLGNPLNTLATTGPVTVNGGNLDLGANSDTVGAVGLTNGTIVGSSGTLTASSYDVQAGTITANLAGTGPLTKHGSGQITVSGNNAYSGATTVSGGILAIQGSHTGGGEYVIGQNTGDNGTLNINASGTIYANSGSAPAFGVGLSANSAGTVVMSAGSLVSGNELWLSAGSNAPGVFNLSGGTVTVSNWTAVGRGGNGGILNISGGSWNNVNANNITIASFGGNVGQVTVSGGQLYSQNAIWVGESGTGQLIVSGGNVSGNANANENAGSVVAGRNGGAVGAIQVNSGALSAAEQIGLGNGAGSYAALTQNGGAISAGSYVVVGFGGDKAVCNLNGGTLTINSEVMTIGAGSGTSTGVVTVAGGVLSAASSTGPQQGGGGMFVGEYGFGALNNYGGTITLNNVGLVLGRNAGATGIANLNGGTVVADVVQRGGGAGTLNFSGGTLKASGSTNAFLTGLNAANVYGGGATIDDGGFAVTVGQPLLAPTGNGVTSIPLFAAGSGYLDAPIVVISGGGGIGATAIAQINYSSGTVTNILVTCPGTGYTSAPNVDLVGGGGSGAAASASAIGANSSGGLTKNGAGTVTLSGTNTYTGTTTINAGTLVGGSFGGSVVVSTGGTLESTGPNTINTNTINGSLTLLSGSTLDSVDAKADIIVVTNGVTLNGGATLNLELGSPTDPNAPSDQIMLTGGVLTHAGTVTINLAAGAGFGAGTNMLITGGGLANTNGFVLGTTPGLGAAYALLTTNGNLAVSVSSTNPINAFWKGNVDANWNTLLGGTNANWATTVSGILNTKAIPGPLTLVTFAAVNPANLNTTLGQDFDINTLIFQTASNVTISGTNTLILANGINAKSTAGPVDINTGALTLPFNEVWSNNSASSFTVDSPISGVGGLTFAGTGTTTLTSTNSYSGGTTITGGTLALANPTGNTLLSTGPVTVNGGALSIGANNNTVGPVTLTSGMITGTVGFLTGSSYTVSGGTISAGLAGSAGVTKIGSASTVSINSSNTFTGPTTVSAGTLTLSGVIADTVQNVVGNTSGGGAVLNLAGGSYNINDTADSQFTDSLLIGAGSGAAGALEMTSGNLSVTRQVGLGNGTGAYGAWTMQGGAATVGSFIVLGSSGDRAVYNQSSGTVTITNNLMTVAAGGTSSVAVANLGGGTFNSTATTGYTPTLGGIFCGEFGAGVVNVSGSANVVLSGWGLRIGQNAGAVGIANLNGGTVTTAAASGGGGRSALNFNGGVLKASGNQTLFVNALSAAEVFGGGAIIDDGGFAITIPQALLAPTGYGVSSIPLSTGGSGYIDCPLISITGGSGTGATAVATVSGGAVTAINVTSPGAGYGASDILTVTFLGGGGTGASAATPVLTSNVSGGLTKQGTGSLQLSGANTYTGLTVVSQGTLIILATQTSTGAVTVANGAGLRVVASGSSTWLPSAITVGSTGGSRLEFDAISNTNIAPASVGTLTFNGTNTIKIVSSPPAAGTYPLISYTTLGGSGTYGLDLPGGMSATLSTISNTIYLSASAVGIAQVWKGNVNTNWDIRATANWTTNGVASTYGDNGPVRFDDTATSFNVAILSNVAPSSILVTNTTTYNYTGSGALGGSAGLTKAGSGLAVLSSSNTYSGNTLINAGTIQTAVNNAIPGGAGKGSVTVNGALDLAGHSNTVNALSGNGVIDSSVAGVAVLTVGSDGSSSIYSGVVQNTASSLALVKAGAGSFTLVGNNSHSGGTTLSAGQLNINNNGALGVGTFTILGGTIDVTTSNAITVANNNPQNWPTTGFTFAGSLTNLNLGTGAVALSNSVGITVTVNANMLTVGGVISGPGTGNDFTKAGAGTLTLLGNNTFSGMTIQNGILAVPTIGDEFVSGGVGAGQFINFGASGPTTGTLLYTGTGEATYKQISLTTAGSGVIDMSGTGLLQFGNDLLVSGNAAHTLTLQGSSIGTGQVAGVISDSSTNSAVNNTTITKAGTGTWVLSGANTYTGNNNIQNGALIVSSIGNIGDTGVNLGGGTTINFGQGNNTGCLVYTGPGESSTKVINLGAGLGSGGGILDQSGTGLLLFIANMTATGGTNHTLTLQGSTGGSGQFAGAIVDNSAINPTALTKTGTGLWALSGTNSYSGVTLVNNGTLAILGDGAISNSPTVTVASGGILDVSGHTGGGMTFVTGQTLHGCGTVVGAVTIANGATLSPGCSPSTLTIMGSLVLNNSSALAYGLGSNSDVAAVAGNLTLAGVLTVTDSGGFALGNYTLITYSGTLVNNGLTVSPLPYGLTGTIVAGGGAVVLQVTGSVDPFTTWANHYGLSGANANGNACPTGDGMSNTNKFLAGFNPTNSAAYLHIISIARTNSNTDIRITYLGANGDTTYSGGPSSRTNVLEFTTGTANGSYATNNFASTGQTNVLGGGTGLGVVTNMVDSGGATNKPSRFYRVRVLLP
jgi:autotransporter-associated beta strand protein